MRRGCRGLPGVALVFALALAGPAQARVETLEWRHPSPGQVAGFVVHIGAQPRVYDTAVDIGRPEFAAGRFVYELEVADEATVYVAVSAYNRAGTSGLSNEGVLLARSQKGPVRIEDSRTFDGLPTSWSLAGIADFVGDGQADLVWRERKSSEHQLWLMDGAAVAGGGAFAVPSKSWRLIGAGDVDGAGAADLFWWDPKAQRVHVWSAAAAIALPEPGPGWEPAGIGDLDGDRRADLLWYAKQDQAYYLWTLDADGVVAEQMLPRPDRQWRLAGLGDFDGSGSADLLWSGKQTGYRVWLMDGAHLVGEGELGEGGKGWKLAGIGDLDGDGRDDLLWDVKGEESWAWLLDGAAVRETDFVCEIEKGWQIAGMGDFDGDGLADLLLRHSKDLRTRIAFVGTAP